MTGYREVSVGLRPASRSLGELTQADIARFAGAGGDFNPLHLDPAVAAAAGFDRPIAMGQLTAGLLAAWLTDWCGVENLRSYQVRFTAPLMVGEAVELSGTVVAIEPLDDDCALATMDLVATADGRTVVTGQAGFVAAS
ncbi:MaoC family dehydratase [Kribbella sp. DT2]|uniref:MaoC family dehydratase n=1 Tax=Kribbella sp. DT2 TaxID=3393427 RepID=UPI003CF41D4A